MKPLAIFLFGLALVLADESAVQEFTTGTNLFAAAVHRELASNENGNFLVSPLSAEIVLALTQSGSKGETAEEIRTSLFLPNTIETVDSAIKTLLYSLPSNQLYELNLANKVYVKEDFEIKEDFKRIASEVYQAGIENINFIQTVEAATKINDWVKQQTENKIENLIDSNSLDNNTRLVLINALYFRSNWSLPFNLANTKKQNFYKTTRDLVQVDTMQSKLGDRYKYYESSILNAKFLEIPFKGENVSMTIILPNDIEGINALQNQIANVFVSSYNLTWEVVNVALPKFKIETSIDFKAILQKLGVRDAFDQNKADLSGIAGKKGDLVIDKVAQKTFIDVNEGGVEAAAATYVDVAVKSQSVRPVLTPKEFIADHPFIFNIKVNNKIIFTGRVVEPSQ